MTGRSKGKVGIEEREGPLPIQLTTGLIVSVGKHLQDHQWLSFPEGPLRKVFWTAAAAIIYLLLYHVFIPARVADAHFRTDLTNDLLKSRPGIRYILFLQAIPIVAVPLSTTLALVPNAQILLPDWAILKGFQARVIVT